MSKGITDRKKDAVNKFTAMFDDSEDSKTPSPEKIIVDVMHGKAGENFVTDRQLEAAKALLPYRLPKLNTIDAHVSSEEMSHDDWIASLQDDDDE